MKKHLLALTVLAATLATTTSVITIAQAGGKHGDHGHHHDHVKHDAHEHGVAAMNLVHFSGEVQIELSTPAYNVVGFEHQPKTEAQEEAVHEAVEALEKPLALFGFGKPCEVELAKVDSPFPEHDDHKDMRKIITTIIKATITKKTMTTKNMLMRKSTNMMITATKTIKITITKVMTTMITKATTTIL